MSASLRRVPTDWVEVADRCFCRRYAHLDVTSTVVAGGEGAMVVDTRATAAQGRALADDVRRLTPLPIRAVVNTHVHFDHTFGNGAFAGVPIIAHESVPLAMPAHEARIKQLYADDHDDPERDDALATEVVSPDTVFASAWALDLGDRPVEVVHLGRGHTDGDAVVRVPDADVLLAGDLVEESAHLSYGVDCWPLEWPATLDLVIGLLTEQTVVVPGHGAVVDRGFVQDQRVDAAEIAGRIAELTTAGVAVDEALAQGGWPYDPDRLEHAVRRGYEQMPLR